MTISMDLGRWPLRPSNVDIALLIFIVALSAILYSCVAGRKGSGLPIVQAGSDMVATLEAAFAQYPNTAFELQVAGMALAILPTCELDTMKMLPESEASIKKWHYDVFLGEYSGMGTKTPEFDRAMRHTLTRSTATCLESFVHEIDFAIATSIGQCSDWTTFNARKVMSEVASIMSGRVFVGLPYSRDKAWIKACGDFIGDVSMSWFILRMIPGPLKSLIALILPPVRSLKRNKKLHHDKVVQALAASGHLGVAGSAEKLVPGGEMIAWLAEQYRDGQLTPDKMARDELLATFASIYNLSNALTYMLFDLATLSKEDLAELREEVNQIEGEMTTTTLSKLIKLDSFLRESMRLSPPSTGNLPRIVTNPQGLRLSNSQIIPHGMRTMIIAHPINQNPSFYPNPTHFDPFRFSRMRQQPGNENRFQHTSTGPDNINFGHGLWACPGRFFANAQLKVVCVHLLRNFEIALVRGREKPRQQYFGMAIFPDLAGEVRLRHQGSV